MGGGNKNKAAATTPAAPAAQAVQMQNFPAFMPGQQGLLAEQMSAGFGAPVSENMGLLSNLYKPVTMPIISRPDQIAQYLTQIGLKPVTTDGLTSTGQNGFSPKSVGVKPTAADTWTAQSGFSRIAEKPKKTITPDQTGFWSKR